MNIWIVTIGSSDVQLDSNKINREKGRTEKQRSDKVWHYWYGDKIKANCYDIAFEPKRVYKEPDEPYRIEPRILGTVYESSSSEVRDEIWNYLTFPLLDNFTKELKTSPLDAIAVLITDQSEIFPSDNTRGKPKCAYWQDTCTLKLILERYFKGNKGKFPDAKCLWIPLSPASGDKGLDDWNYVLDLVRHKLRDKLDSEEIQVQPNETVYVSHQAGTPAISSAVQFVTLAQFEERVQFLVSNEQDSQFTRFIESSSYLRGIQLEKAKKLLERHDYSGMKDLLAPYLKPEIENLLDAAIQWNFAKFEDFKEKLLQHSDGKFVQEVQERTQKENWWWTAYEAAYLAVVRLKQGNTVEAMFHSFRALEGLAIKYAKNQGENLYSRKVFNYLKQQNLKEWNNHLYIKEIVRSEVSKLPNIRNDILDRRNSLFHQLEGFKEKDLYDAWKATDKPNWKDRILLCLNFISRQSFTPPLEEASLMFQVHKKLKNVIENYEHAP